MNIITTKYPDIEVSNIDQSKVELANKIINNVYPLFDEVVATKNEELINKRNELQKKREKVLKDKEELEATMVEYKRKQKIRKLLERIQKVVSAGLVYDSGLRHETVILLKVIHKLPEEKLDYHLIQTLKIIGKRFKK